jgi:hypothetical protein
MPKAHPRPWHRGSVFGDGRRRPLDREHRARFRYLVQMHHTAGRLTRAARDVAMALLRRLGTDGRCDPCHATLASDVGCCDRTVRRATADIRDLGLLRWQTRLVRDSWRVEQTSNAYELLTMEKVAHGPSTGGQRVRQIRFVQIQGDLPLPSPAERQAAQAALAERRAAVEQRLLGSRLAGRQAGEHEDLWGNHAAAA